MLWRSQSSSQRSSRPQRHRSRSRVVQVLRCDAGRARLRNPETENAALLWFEALLHCVASNQREAQNHPKGCRGCACGPSAPLGGQSGSRPFKEGISIMCCRVACVLYVHAASVIACDICTRSFGYVLSLKLVSCGSVRPWKKIPPIACAPWRKSPPIACDARIEIL